jgi:hypothetical protein
MSEYITPRNSHLEFVRSYLNDPQTLRDGMSVTLRDALFNIIQAIEKSEEIIYPYGHDTFGQLPEFKTGPQLAWEEEESYEPQNKKVKEDCNYCRHRGNPQDNCKWCCHYYYSMYEERL